MSSHKRNQRKPYYRPSKSEVHNTDSLHPSTVNPDLQRPDRPDTPVPLRFLTIRRGRMHYAGHRYVHRHLSAMRNPTRPDDAAYLGVGDVGEYMYQHFKTRKYDAEDVEHPKEHYFPPLMPIKTELTSQEPEDGKIDGKTDVMPEHGPSNESATQRHWESAPEHVYGGTR